LTVDRQTDRQTDRETDTEEIQTNAVHYVSLLAEVMIIVGFMSMTVNARHMV